MQIRCLPVYNPGMLVTLVWTDSDVTKEWWNRTWTNGETKEICPGFYTNSYLERWYYPRTATNKGRLFMTAADPGHVSHRQQVAFKPVGTVYPFVQMQQYKTSGQTDAAQDISSKWINYWELNTLGNCTTVTYTYTFYGSYTYTWTNRVCTTVGGTAKLQGVCSSFTTIICEHAQLKFRIMNIG